MPNTAYWIVFAAILLPAAIYFTKAYQEKSAIADIRDFFPLKRTISSGEYRSTTVAAGMSLATVIIAFINLAPFLGITLIVSVVSFSFSFILLYPCVERIMEYNPENDSIQTYLGKTYQSDFVRYAALLFSIFGYISIFCMELIVGVTVLEPFLGRNVLIFSAIYLVFIVIYSLMSGYRAIIATDKWQLRFIVAGVFVLVFFGFLQFNTAGPEINASSLMASVSGSWVPMWSFVIGITVMNLPAPISDAGTWQRLCSTRDVKEARKGLVQVVIIFAILWTALVLFGCFYAQLAQGLHGFDPSKGTLIADIITTMCSSGVVGYVILFVFFLGLFSAMISTADSLLIVTGQLLAIDFLKLQPKKGLEKYGLKRARQGMAIIAIVSFVIFSFFYIMQFDVVQLVFSIYGAQLAMFPAVFASLFLRKWIDFAAAHWAGGLSILFGFVAGWASALYGKLTGAVNWLYNAPVSALVAAMVIFAVFSIPAWRRSVLKVKEPACP